MGIDFSSLGGNQDNWTCSCGTSNTGAFCIGCGQPKSVAASTVSVAESAQASGSVTLNLTKGSILDLTKRNPGLKRIKAGAGWDIANIGADFDLDVSAFLLNANGKINSGTDVVFFNNMSVPGVKLNGDNRTGAGDGDDETIDIDLTAIAPNVQKIVICVTIADAMAKQQTFGMVNNSYVRLMDADQNDKELCVFRLKEDGSTSTAIIFAELYRDGTDWAFRAIGEGKVGDLNTIAAMYS